MLSLEKCRQLAPNLKDLPEKEALEIVANLYEMAQLALEAWEGGSKNP